MTQQYGDALEGSGLRSTQFAILVELHRWAEQPPTVAQLAAKLVMDRSALGHNLRPLERDGCSACRKQGVRACLQSLVAEGARAPRHPGSGSPPGATPTDFWDIAGVPIAALPKEIQERVMSAADLVDAALADLDQGESVTIPALPEAADWTAYESARDFCRTCRVHSRLRGMQAGPVA